MVGPSYEVGNGVRQMHGVLRFHLGDPGTALASTQIARSTPQYQVCSQQQPTSLCLWPASGWSYAPGQREAREP